MKSDTRLKTDPFWNRVPQTGTLIGHYAFNGPQRMIVRHGTGWEKTTQRTGVGPAGDDALARVILSQRAPR
jgi:hypothetical protein